MSLIAIPNVSEGKDRRILNDLAASITGAGARVLDTHSDEIHGRSVFTVAGAEANLTEAMVALAEACARTIDLTQHSGVHPRLGALDVCPFVPVRDDLDAAVRAARMTAHRIGQIGLPVYLYGAAARRSETRELPSLRKGGLKALIERSDTLRPDEGPATIGPRTGVVCVGAREVLIAFNVWLRCPAPTAQEIAKRIRESDGGLPGVRALGLQLSPEISQVSMNLVAPARTGIADAYAAVRTEAERLGAEIEVTETVGLVPERFLPDPESEVTRRSISPGHSLESVLGSI